MNLIILLLIIILLSYAIYCKHVTIAQEPFSMNSMEMKRGDILDNVQTFAGSPSLNIVGSDVDDQIITNFIQRQIGETEQPPEGAMGDVLSYPEEPVKEITAASSLADSDKVNRDYENIIAIKRKNQKIKLNNLLLELKKINSLETKLKC